MMNWIDMMDEVIDDMGLDEETCANLIQGFCDRCRHRLKGRVLDGELPDPCNSCMPSAFEVVKFRVWGLS